MRKLPKPSQYPKELTINGISWRVVFVDQIQGEDLLGLCDSENRTIQIIRRLKPKTRLAIFLHELIHAIEYSYSFSIPHGKIYKLSEALADVIIINH